MPPHPLRQADKDKRARAFQAARIALDEGRSVTDAAESVGANAHSTREAVFILSYGTAEEISNVQNNEIALRQTVELIKRRVPKSERPRKLNVLSDKQKHAEASDAQLYAKLRDALHGINSMPRPADVVVICRRQPRRGEAMNKLLIEAYSWMVEFSDAWTK